MKHGITRYEWTSLAASLPYIQAATFGEYRQEFPQYRIELEKQLKKLTVQGWKPISAAWDWKRPVKYYAFQRAMR